MVAGAGDFRAEDFRSKGWWRDETLPGWLDRAASANGDGMAIATADGAMTYRELADRVYKLASGLRSFGIGRGDIVALHLPNVPEFLMSWLAVNACGATMQTVHLAYGLREIEQQLSHSGAKLIVAPGSAKGRSPAGEVVALLEKVKSLRSIISVGRAVAGAEQFARRGSPLCRARFGEKRGEGGRSVPVSLHLRHDVGAKGGLGQLQPFPEQCPVGGAGIRLDARDCGWTGGSRR